jgi:hypothetical protein
MSHRHLVITPVHHIVRMNRQDEAVRLGHNAKFGVPEREMSSSKESDYKSILTSALPCGNFSTRHQKSHSLSSEMINTIRYSS